MKTQLTLITMLFAALASACSPVPSSIPTKALPPTTAPATAVTYADGSIELVSRMEGGPDPLDHPTDLAIDREDHLYVVDAGNHRILKLDKNGQFLLTWGSKGADDGQFNFDRTDGFFIGGVGLDSQDNVFVADNQKQRIQKFDSSGNFLLKWGSKGTGNGQILSPFDVAVDGQGNIYVADDVREDIQKFDSNGDFLLKFGGHGKGDGQLNSQVEDVTLLGGLAVDSLGNVYVADHAIYRVQKFDSSGKFLQKWKSPGEGNSAAGNPIGVALDGQENLYVSIFGYYLGHWQHQPPRIQMFDGNGEFLLRWGSDRGHAKGILGTPWGIALDSEGNVYIVDYSYYNIQKFRQK